MIVEGPDMVGKTKFCAALRAALAESAPRFGVVHADRFSQAESGRTLEEARKRIQPWCVCDRLHLSEMVYGSVCRGSIDMDQEGLDEISMLLRRAGGMVVVLYARPDAYNALIRTWWNRGEAFSRTQCRKVNNTYRNLVINSGINGLYLGKTVVASHEITKAGEYPAENKTLVQLVASVYLEKQKGVLT